MASNYYNGNGHLPKTSADALVIFFLHTHAPHVKKMTKDCAHPCMCSSTNFHFCNTRQKILAHLVCWGLPAVVLIVSLATKNIGYPGDSPVCMFRVNGISDS